MKIFVLIPSHNRKELTLQCVKDLIAQDIAFEIVIVVIDDGSSDGTEEALDQLVVFSRFGSRKIEILRGDGSWWWSRCIDEAIQYIKPQLRSEDWVLFLNDDVRINSNYCSTLISVNEKFGKCIVMSQIVDISNGSTVESCVSVLSKTLEIRSAPVNYSKSVIVSRSDVAPGRGTLYPGSLFLDGISLDCKNLPHYLSDYEFSVRAKRTGLDILCSHNSEVFTKLEWGNQKKFNLIKRYTATGSPQNLRASWTFWRTWEPDKSRILLLGKMFRYRLLPTLGFRRKP